MKKKFKFYLTIILVCVSLYSQAQLTNDDGNEATNQTGEKKSSFYIFLAPSVPSGDFKDENNGCAKTGFTFGIDCMYGKNFKFIWNQNITFNSASFDDIEWGYFTFYENIGFRIHGGNDMFKVYGIIMGGISTNLLTGDFSDFGTSYAFTSTLGGGFIVNNNFNIGLRFTNSEPTFYDPISDISISQKMPLVNLSVGYEF